MIGSSLSFCCKRLTSSSNLGWQKGPWPRRSFRTYHLTPGRFQLLFSSILEYRGSCDWLCCIKSSTWWDKRHQKSPAFFLVSFHSSCYQMLPVVASQNSLFLFGGETLHQRRTFDSWTFGDAVILGISSEQPSYNYLYIFSCTVTL